MVKETQLIQGILEKLPSIRAHFSAFVGLDGYIDKIQRPVQFQKRQELSYYPTLAKFGQKVIDASNKSTQIELRTQLTKIGGNAPIMANALASLGIRNSCLGAFGYPSIDPVFEQMHQNSTLISVGLPAETNALEFDDGKLILSELTSFSEIDWKTVKERIDLKSVREKVANADLIALVDWCNLPHATSIWKGILEDFIKPDPTKERHFFFDLADPSKKEKDKIRQVLSLIKEFMPFGEVTLGLNANEAGILVKLLGGPTIGNGLERSGQYLFNALKLDRIVIHPLDRALVFQKYDHYNVKGRIIKNPLVTTGGGDNFNAGFMFGFLHRFSIEESIILAMATSGAYVEQGKSPSVEDLSEYLSKWHRELIQTTP